MRYRVAVVVPVSRFEVILVSSSLSDAGRVAVLGRP
jgi:hypothetical protein